MRPHLHSLVRWPFRPGSPFPWNENSETSNQPRAVEQLCLLTSAQKRPCSKSRRSTGYAPTPSRPSRNPSRDRTLKGWLLIALFGTLGDWLPIRRGSASVSIIARSVASIGD